MVVGVVDSIGIHVHYFFPLHGVHGRTFFRVAAGCLFLPACCLYLGSYQNFGFVGTHFAVAVVDDAFYIVGVGVNFRYVVVYGYTLEAAL